MATASPKSKGEKEKKKWKFFSKFFSKHKRTNEKKECTKANDDSSLKNNSSLVTECPSIKEDTGLGKIVAPELNSNVLFDVNGATCSSPLTSVASSKENRSNDVSTDNVPDLVQSLEIHAVPVSSLTEEQRHYIQTHLDGKVRYYPDWYYLGTKIYEQNKDRLGELKGMLDTDYSGGGNPGLTFLEILANQNPMETCANFAAKAKTLKRNDIYEYLRENPKTLLKDIDDKCKETLARKLNDRNGKNWRFFVDQYLTDPNVQKNKIEMSIKEPGIYSPTSRLLKMFSNEGFSISKIADACDKIRLKNVADKLREYEKELKAN